ncbi:FliA/WhiG family RNA polymerase sigma factor [Halobacillus massiliensis]|uniref:FliA/WhiG family RNA polymerase sigma factor n=1 Tax=Halobacillus massiliensis TaxID=1926286 RepID=UPI0009E1E780|nr:FliA/WhiG family RNA polymerase sigma factor [Halobacillus massiliensis]
MHSSTICEQELWTRWIEEGNSETANELVKLYDYLVSFHVQRIAAHLPKNVTAEDVRSFGLLGLYDAIKKFDLSRDLKFDTYASFRIRGSIIDGLRKEDWLSRSAREKAKKIDIVSERLEQKLQRLPSSEEIAHEIGMSRNEVEEIVKDSLFANILSMEEKAKGNHEGRKEGIGYSIPDQNTKTPYEYVENKESINELTQHIKKLNEKEQLIISLFYTEELTLTEIGEVLDLSTSRISQIHAKAIFKLRSSLQNVADTV